MKKWMCLLLAGALLLSLTACKKQDTGETGNTESTNQQTTESPQSNHQQKTENTGGENLSQQTTLAYEAFLDGRQSVNSGGREIFVKDYGATGNGINAYAYHDVSGDGIPELFIKSSHTNILSYTEGKLVEWYTSASWQQIYLLEDGGVLDIYHNLGSYYEYLSFDANGKADRISFSEPSGQPNGAWDFQGKKVTKEEWEELTKPYLSQKRTEPDWKQWYNYTVEQLPHSYRQVLNNEKLLYAQGQGGMLLKNYLFPQSSDNTDISVGNVTTWEGQKMLAIQQLEGTVVLFESNGVVYGNRYGFRSLYDLQTNGVYNWMHTDDEGLHYGVNKLAFKDGEFADVALYRVDQKGLDQVQYTLEGKVSDQQTLEAYSATLKSAEVTWVKSLPSHSYALTDAPDEPGMKLLVITDNSTKETIQTLRLGACEWFIPEPIYTDITFDGNKDILVPSQRTASGAYFAGFVWDGMAYVYTLGLENIPNIALDWENKMILSCRTQSQITSYSMHRFNTEKWVFEIVRSLYWEPADSGVTVVESVYTYGKETEVNRFTATAADDGFSNYAPNALWDLDSDKWRNWVYTP